MRGKFKFSHIYRRDKPISPSLNAAARVEKTKENHFNKWSHFIFRMRPQKIDFEEIFPLLSDFLAIIDDEGNILQLNSNMCSEKFLVLSITVGDNDYVSDGKCMRLPKTTDYDHLFPDYFHEVNKNILLEKLETLSGDIFKRKMLMTVSANDESKNTCKYML